MVLLVLLDLRIVRIFVKRVRNRGHMWRGDDCGRVFGGRQSAFTLIELLVAIAVMGVLSMGLLGFLGNFLQLKFRTEARLRMREEGEYALDRIEYLVRNSITLPDICSSGSEATEMKVNLRSEDRAVDYIHRMRVFLENSELIEVSTYANGTNHDATRTQVRGSGSAYYNLTRSNPGSTGVSGQKFKVSNFKVKCTHDTVFLNGYSVLVEFDIVYQRNSLNASTRDLVEHFSRDVAVRNVVPFQK